MSGVIDKDGQQWEHCMACNEFVRIQDLLYEQKSDRFPYGRDICSTCVDLEPEKQDEIAEAARQLAIERSLAHYAEIGWKVELQPDGAIRILETKPMGVKLTVQTLQPDGGVTEEVVDI